MPWLSEEETLEALQPLLLGAYVADNVRSQLETGVKRDDSYSGLLLVFRFYNRTRERFPDFKSPSLEHLLNLHKEGKLMAHLVALEGDAEKPAEIQPDDDASTGTDESGSD